MLVENFNVNGFLGGGVEFEINFQVAVFVIVDGLSLNKNVVNVNSGLCIKINFAEQTAESEKVLVFKPRAAAETEDGDGKFIFARDKIGRQIEFGRREGVFAVPDKFSVQINSKRGLRALKRNENLLPILRSVEIFHITADRILALRNLSRSNKFMPVPRISRVGVVRLAVAFHLKMSRDANCFPIMAINFGSLKIFRIKLRIFSIKKMPQSVQRKAKRTFQICQLVEVRKIIVVTVRRQSVLLKIIRIGQFIKIKIHVHTSSIIFGRSQAG